MEKTTPNQPLWVFSMTLDFPARAVTDKSPFLWSQGYCCCQLCRCSAPHVQQDLSSEFWWNPNYCNPAVALFGSCKLHAWDDFDLHHNVPVVWCWQSGCVSWGRAQSSISSKSGKTQSVHRKKTQPPELLVAFQRATFCSVPEIAHSEAHWAAFPALRYFWKGRNSREPWDPLC